MGWVVVCGVVCGVLGGLLGVGCAISRFVRTGYSEDEFRMFQDKISKALSREKFKIQFNYKISHFY